jgi:phosphoglycerate dehydrogenase-like enzyme
LKALQMGWPDGAHIRGRMLRHRRVGLVGFGAIAQAVVKRLIGWDVEIVAYMPRPKPLPSHVRSIDLDDLMRSSDIVLVLAALTAESRHLIDERRIGLMKPNALLVNTARGGLVDEAALVRAASNGRIRVALDSFEIEPLPPDAIIRDLPGALLTPHCVGHTIETLAATRRACIDNVMAVLAGNPPPYTVNPEVLPRWIERWQNTRQAI